MKTLKTLQSESWYRLLQVIYVLSFLFIAIIGVYYIIETDDGYRNYKKGKILCPDQHFIDASQFGVDFGKMNTSRLQLTNPDLHEKIISVCEQQR